MKILFINAVTREYGDVCISVEDSFIKYIGKEIPDGRYDRVIDCRRNLIMPALYNCHTHAAMTLFRGYGEDMPLQQWLEERIFPAEDRLTDRAVYVSSQLAAAEMIRNGIVSFTDMYFFCDQTAKAVIESGMKANIGRSIVSFDDSADPAADSRFAEAKALFSEYNNAGEGRVKIDMSLHAEYTNVAGMVRAVSDYAAEVGANMHIHLSETQKEQIGRAHV